MDWYKENVLTEGDEIKIKVIRPPFDPPAEVRHRISKEEELQRKIDYFYRLKEELKEHLKDGEEK